MLFPMLLFMLLMIMVFLFQGLRVAFRATPIDFGIPSANLSVTFSSILDGGPPLPPLEPNNGDASTVPKKTRVRSADEEYYEWSPRPYEPMPRPPEEAVVYDWNVTGDPQWLINFAITGFPKCGTSTLMHYFADNPEIQIFGNERCELGANQHVPLFRDMYQKFAGGDYVRGIKCPSNLENSLALTNYAKWLPKTDMIVGIRHPVKWFESFYNHRIQNNYEMLHPNNLTGGCGKKSSGVCTNRANFHVNLAMLHLTKLKEEERNLLPAFGQRWINRKYNWTGRVFLYDVDQLNDKNETTAYRFRKDLQRFLYLRKELPPMVWFKPGRKKLDDVEQNRVDALKVDICHKKYAPVRKVLMKSARNVSKWVSDYFIGAQDVFVSSPDNLRTILKTWNRDPCEDGGKYKTASAKMNCTKYGCFLADS